MLLTQARVALLHICLGLAQAAWITPFVLLLYPEPARPWPVLALVAGLLLGWMLVLELLSLRFEAGSYYAMSLGLMGLTSLLLVRVLLYGGRPPWDPGWLLEMLRETVDFRGGVPPALVIIGANLFLWQRATVATSRDLTFFGVGVTFRVGMLLLFLGGGAYAIVRGVQLTSFIWFYFAAGLTAISLARIGEKAVEAQSAGGILPARRLLQVFAGVAVTLGLGMFLSSFYTPGGVRGFLRLFAPVWELARPLLLALLIASGRILEPLLLWLESVIVSMMRQPATAGERAGSLASPGEAANPLHNFPGWPLELLRTAFIAVLFIGAAVGALVFLLVYLERVRSERGRAEVEDEGVERAPYGGGLVSRGLGALRDAVRLTRRLGIGRQLLAAISIQNIYANLSRIGSRHGHARRPAQPPDDYLPVLVRVFPGQEAPLERITNAYMRVHYGDQPVEPHELAALRADYRVVRESEIERS